MVNRMCPPAAGGRFGAVDSERRIMHHAPAIIGQLSRAHAQGENQCAASFLSRLP
jgi:hypothetical protein